MTDIPAEVARLETNFPLPARRRRLPADARDAHRSILMSYVTTGTPTIDLDTHLVEALAAHDLIVVEDGCIVGAYPFSTRPTGHHLLIDQTIEVDAMCAIDAIAVAPVFGVSTEVRSSCAQSGRQLQISQDPHAAPKAEPNSVHLGIRWQVPVGSASTSMCREMVFLADAENATAWAASGGEASVYDLNEGVEFASLLFDHLVDW